MFFSRLKLFFYNKGLRKFELQIKNSSWLLFDSILKNVFNFFSAILLARYLGPNQYGLLSYSMGFVGMFTSLITLGLDNISVRELSRESKREVNKIMGSSFVLKLLGYLFMILLIFVSTVILKTNEPNSGSLILFLCLAYLFHTLFTIDYYFQSRLESRKTVISNQIGVTLGFIFKVSAVVLKLPLIFFVISFLIESFFISLSMFVLYQKENSVFKWQFDKKLAKTFLLSSSPIIISGLINSFFRRFDVVMVQNILGSTNTGFYSVAKKISESIYFIPTAISISVYPALVKSFLNKKKFDNIYKRVSSVLFLISIIIVLSVFLFADWIIPIIFGGEYLISAKLLKFLILAAPFVFLNNLNIRWLIINNKQRFYVISSLFGLVGIIVFNLLFLSNLGVSGAAISYSLSWFISSFLVYLIIPQTREGIVLQIKSLFMIPFHKKKA